MLAFKIFVEQETNFHARLLRPRLIPPPKHCPSRTLFPLQKLPHTITGGIVLPSCHPQTRATMSAPPGHPGLHLALPRLTIVIYFTVSACISSIAMEIPDPSSLHYVDCGRSKDCSLIIIVSLVFNGTTHGGVEAWVPIQNSFFYCLELSQLS